MIVVTGATGQLGRLVVEGLLKRLPGGEIVAAVRSPEKAGWAKERGVVVRKADYGQPDTLSSAFAGADKVLLISGSDVGKRVAQHKAVVEAARNAGVAHIVYTSAPRADTSALVLAPDHKATEAFIQASGLTYTFLRNGWYSESYTQAIEQGARTGNFVGSAGDGRVASAPRADYAAAAVEVLTGEGHENKIYELSGDVAWTHAELATEIGKATGRQVTYTDLSPEEHKAALTDAGLPAPIVELLAAIDADIKEGVLSETPGDLKALIGRPSTPIAVTVAEVVKGL
jgi:NAD(P)H dehydrogenase (quinone)